MACNLVKGTLQPSFFALRYSFQQHAISIVWSLWTVNMHLYRVLQQSSFSMPLYVYSCQAHLHSILKVNYMPTTISTSFSSRPVRAVLLIKCTMMLRIITVYCFCFSSCNPLNFAFNLCRPPLNTQSLVTSKQIVRAHPKILKMFDL